MIPLETKRIFIAATRQNDGKTTASLGLISAFKKRVGKIGFIKPVGQRYVEEEGHKIDEDSVLIERVCGIDCSLKDMSPIAVEKGFTESYILRGNREELVKRILDSFARVAQGKELVIIEGTGHAGVGSVFDLSNATVAKLLNSKVILVSMGGIGRPIDEIVLNQALFEKEGVELIGVIVNKVDPDKFDKINSIVRRGLARKGIEVLGVIPHEPILTSPTVCQVMEEIGAELLCGEKGLKNKVNKIVVGAMEPHEALHYFGQGELVITPGDREDLVLAAMSSYLIGGGDRPHITGILLTGGILPQDTIMNLICRTDIPVLLVKDDTYKAASKVYDMTIKIRPEDVDKVKRAIEIVEQYVDIDKIYERI